jgi:hypothetical protein
VGQARTASARGEIVVGGLPLTDTQSGAATDFAPFLSEPTATAASGAHLGAADGFHDSTIALGAGSLSVEAGGAALGFFDAAGLPLSDSAAGEASALFELVFEVALPTSWLLEGVLGAELEQRIIHLPGGAVSVDAGAWIELAGTGPGVVFRQEITDPLADFQPVQVDVLAGGVLVPDTYSLRAFASALSEGTGATEGSGISIFALRFEATVVPEPGTLLLVGAGLAGLSARRSRRAGGGRTP